MCHPGAQPYSRQQLRRSAPRHFFRPTRDPKRHHHVFECRELAQQVMELEHKTHSPIPQLTKLGFVASVNGLTSDYYIAARGFVQCTEHMHQRAFSGAAGADDRDHLAALH